VNAAGFYRPSIAKQIKEVVMNTDQGSGPTINNSIIRKMLSLVVSVSLLGISSLAKADILVASSESHSVEWFNNKGAWIGTFATTGPRVPYGLAQNPVNGDVFVATFTGTILRYHSNGQPAANWDTFNVPPDGNPVESVLFDPVSGDLWVATYFGESGYVANLYRYAAASLTAPNPQLIDTLPTGLRRSNQMAFDRQRNLCVASYFGDEVRCFDPITHAQAFDYNPELVASGIVAPGGFAFDAQNHLYVNDAFGRIGVEQVPHVGPIATLAQGLTTPVLFATLNGTGVYAPSFHNADARLDGCVLNADTRAAAYACNDYDFKADTVYKIDPAGVVTNFITSHVWGPYQLIFARVTKLRP
jgi:hypothetical protein